MTLEQIAPEDSAHDHRVLLALSHAAQAVQRAHTTDEVYAAIGTQVANLDYHAGVYTLTEDGAHLTLAYLSPEAFPQPGAEKMTGLTAQDYSAPVSLSSFCAPIILEQQTVFCPEVVERVTETMPPPARAVAKQALAQLGVKYGICAPLVSGGEACGILVVMGRDLTEADMPAVTLFANQISIALDNARLYQATRDQAAQLEAARQQTEAKLQESYENILALLNAPADIVLSIDPQGVILTANLAFLNRFGKPLAEVAGTSVYNYLPPDIGAVRKAHIDEAVRARTVIVFEDYRAGRYFENTLYPVIDADGQVKRLVAIGQDITQRKQAEATLRESEARYKRLLESVTSYVYTVKVEDGRPAATTHGPGCVSVTGYTAEEYAADPYLWINMVPEADREAVTAQAAQVLAQEKTLPLEHRLIHKDGSLRWVSCALVARTDADGNLAAYDGMITDITARKQLEADLLAERATLAQRVEARTAELSARTAELSAANAELAGAMRAKDAFLATMSHELRTPLTAVMGLSEALQLEVYGPLTEKQRGSLETIHASGQHLLLLITDILDLSKIESGKLDLQISPLVVDEICQASLSLIREQATKKKQHITYSVDNSVTQLHADGRRLVQILVNLLSNAVKFTPDGGQIGLEVAGDSQQQLAYFTVWDTGIGIAPDMMPRLFQPFVQLDNRLSRAYEGTGLGLALVQRLAEMHGGRVGLESEGVPGKGSRFTVSLPWKGAEAAAARHRQPPLPARTALPAASGSRAPLLLVEDDEGTLIALTDFLRSRGYQVTNARSGAEAIAEAWEIGPALILMDIQMPGMNGLEAIRLLRARAETSTTPIIALTALAMPGDRERCLEAGANEYLTKPVKLGDLVRTIEGLLPQT